MTIAQALLKAEITKKQLSEKLNIPLRTIQNWESGDRTCPGYVEKLIVEKIFSLYLEAEIRYDEKKEIYSCYKKVEEGTLSLFLETRSIEEILKCISTLTKEGYKLSYFNI